MGTIQKRDENVVKTTYQARVRKAGHPALSKNFKTKAEAQQWITEREAEMSRGTFVDTKSASEWTFGKVLEKYRNEVTPKKRGSSVETIRINALLRDEIAKYSIANLTPQVVAKWRDRRLKSVAGSTVNRDLNVMHHALEVARKEWGIGMPVNVVGEVARAKEPPSRVRRLAPAEEVAILAACSKARNSYLRAAVELALETGMRQAEVVGLEWQYVDMTKRTVHLLESKTKNGDNRGVPLSPRAMEILEGLDADKDDDGNRVGRVFPHLTTEALKRAFIRACERAGVEDFRFHDLRHEATSRFFEKGFNPMEVASITGHKTLAMLKRYTHLSAEDLAKRL